MKLTREQVEHLADLARIELTDVEKVKFQNQLSAILGYVNKLNEVDTKGVEPTAQLTGLENVWREDQAEGCDAATRELLVKNFPEGEGGLVKVRGVFGITTDEF